MNAASSENRPATCMQAGMRSPRLGAMVGSSIVGAGRGIIPALDYLATSVIGDNPVLTAGLQYTSQTSALPERRQPMAMFVLLACSLWAR